MIIRGDWLYPEIESYFYAVFVISGKCFVYRLMRKISLRLAIPLCLSLAVLLSGCESVESEFVYSEETNKLFPEAAEAVKQSLLRAFGTPAQPRIPAFMPVDRGGIPGEVVKVSDDRKQSQLKLESSSNGETDIEINPGQPVEFLFDPEEAFDFAAEAIEQGKPNPFDPLSELRVVNFDSETGLLTVDKKLPEIELIDAGLQIAINPNSKLEQGRELYNQHCMHCHGVSGDGNGPTAKTMTPRPRDYRKGIFKFTSTGPQDKVSTADLKHIIVEGIPGTYMASFKMLADEELDLIVEYVKYLTLRGVAEQKLDVEVGIDFSQSALDDELADIKDAAEKQKVIEEFRADWEEFLKGDYREIDQFGLLDVADEWEQIKGEGNVLLPSVPRTDPQGPSAADPSKSSVENGRLLYLGKTAQCAACHGEAGKGDGFQTRQIQKKPDGSEYEQPGLYDTWGNPTKPRDLTQDIYRGGRRPIDIYRRIYAGIKGSPMPVFGGKGLTDEQIWDIVNYVMTIPYE